MGRFADGMTNSKHPLKILLIEDDPDDARLLTKMIARADGDVAIHGVRSLADAVTAFAADLYDLIVLDLALPDSRGLASLERLQAHAPTLPIIVLTGADDRDAAVEAVRLGAQDYFIKWRVEGERLVQAIRYAIERKRTEVALRRRGDGQPPLPAPLQLDGILRDKQALEEVFFGRYQLKELIGEGSMGLVFRGWDPKLQRSVALKTIHLENLAPGEDPTDLAPRLLREAVTLAAVSHPNIVSVYDVGDAYQAAFIAMELVEGTTLEEYLREKTVLPWREVVTLGLGLARGLAAAHARGVVHHDVKPGNVLLGRDGAVKVNDFGLSRYLTTVTQEPAVVCGTPGYLPPEAILGEKYDEKGDLFAFGVVLYQLLTGSHPFWGRNTVETCRNTLSFAVPPPSHRIPSLDGRLEEVVLTLLEKAPARRTLSAEEAAQRLEELAFRYQLRWQPPAAFRGRAGRPRDARTETQLIPLGIAS